MECIRCGKAEVPQPQGFCAACAATVRVELVEDLKQIGTYLSSWAAFDEWLRRRGSPS
jgi:uncharacterized OB-fold protein